MTTNYDGAENEMLSLINTAWQASTTAIVGYIPALYWPRLDAGIVPDNSKFYARIMIMETSANQATLSNNVGSFNKRRFCHRGFLTIQICGPKNDITAGSKIKKLSQLCIDTLRKSTQNVIIKNPVSVDLQPESGCSKTNVNCQYTFDELA